MKKREQQDLCEHYCRKLSNLPILICLILPIIMLLSIISFINIRTNQVKGKDKISDEIILTDYLYDNADYFDDTRQDIVIKGLEYFYTKTGVQMIIVTQKEKTTELLTKKMYDKMLNDQTHILIVLPITGIFGGNNEQYYWIGENALKVVSDKTMNRLFETIDDSWGTTESKWYSKLISLTDLILSK